MSTSQKATSMDVAILAANAAGTPRLIRAIVPRQGAAGLSAVEDIARDHVAALSSLYVGQQKPVALLDGGTATLPNGAHVVKLNQTVGGIIVNGGEIHVLLHKDNSFAAASGTLLPATRAPVFTSTSSVAFSRALDQHFGAGRVQPAITAGAVADLSNGGWQPLTVAPTPGLQLIAGRARQELAQVGGSLLPAWSVEVEGNVVAPGTDPDMPQFSAHRYLISDGGRILRDVDLVAHDAFLYRAYMETTGNRRPLDGPLQGFSPHPTGVPDGSSATLAPSNLVVMEAFNGPKDPWLANDATTTSGNNAMSFSDFDADQTFSAGDIRPNVTSGRILNFNYDHTLSPLANADQAKAGAVNSFFMVNWMHDWWYDSGFTEAAGNGQVNNFGRGGVGGDPLIVFAQAGANAGLRNNADMSTPADGANPRMRMFLWTAGTVTSLSAAGRTPRAEPFANGPRTFDLTGDLVTVTDGTAPFDDGCQPITSNVAGKIVLVTFSGVCGSAATVNNAKAAGAIGILIADPASDDPRAFAGSAAANIPGLAIGKTDGAALVAAIAAGPVSVELKSDVSGPERDGDLDNGVVAHEWGHYLHHRLADCGAQQCSGMSEGWGDFNALMMMVRDGDNRDGTFAEGIYALTDGTPDVGYFGIRRFPYSRDRSKNNLSFRHIGDENPLPTNTPGHPGGANSEVHNTGEIWATMMWEAFNVLADAHGVTPARRRMSDYVVTGLLLTPPDATFTEARDAILAAASALDTDDMLLMAAAFAGRGAGSCAVSPDVNSPTNSGVVESGTLAGKLAMGGISLTDDGISCDHDGYLDPGESGALRVTVANNGILAAEAVNITATTSSPGVRIGGPIKIPLLQPFTTAALTIPVTLLPTAPRNSIVTINVHAVGQETCDAAGVNFSLSVRTGADDVLAASKTDAAETRAVAWTAAAQGDLPGNIWGHAVIGTNQTFFGKDSSFPTDSTFTSPPLTVSTDPFVLSFKHAYSLEASGGLLFDGGMIEISLNGGSTWSDVTAFGVNPGYTGALFIGSDNPLGGRNAYSGVSAGFPALIPVSLNFGTVFAGLTVMVRFRIGTDAAASQIGWVLDDIAVSGITNTPFPVLVSEPDTCTARRGDAVTSGVLAVRSAPATSLRDLDGVCILAEQAEQ